MAGRSSGGVGAGGFAPALLVLAAAALGTASGCGDSHSGTASSSYRSPASGWASGGAAATSGYSLRDGDADTDDVKPPRGFGDDDGSALAPYGGLARPADARAISALVKRYYLAAAAGEGSAVCSLVDPSLSAGVEVEYGSGHGGCVAAMTRLLREQHAHLAAEQAASMRVIAVHVKGRAGLAVLEFRTAPESQMVVQRDGRSWKVDALLGTYMP